MATLFKNNASGVLASGITNVATSIVLSSGQGSLFPSPTGGDVFYATMAVLTQGIETSWEIIKCTARTADTLTVVRAQEGTVGIAWPSGTKIEMRITAGELTEMAGAGIVTFPAGAALGGHRIVILNANSEAIYASNLDPTHLHKVLGLTTGAVSIGSPATIRVSGEITESTWTWTLNQPIFLGIDGLITQTGPTTGFLVIIAFPITPTKVFIRIQEAVNLV